jgi:hypothetical protein
MTLHRIFLLSLTVASALAVGCHNKAPAKPSGVPASAVWAGGADGGAFFDCVPSQKGEPNVCTVYNDSTGAIYMSGKFVLQGQTRGAKADELKYDSTDGNKIYLERNLVLVPIPSEKADAER